ncbi:MAG: DUF6383 domain-containing protein [Paludibacteraceae bacterium]|nr:DUF6383 domain-containing protein [Paludibacteraceae bacterium]
MKTKVTKMLLIAFALCSWVGAFGFTSELGYGVTSNPFVASTLTYTLGTGTTQSLITAYNTVASTTICNSTMIGAQVNGSSYYLEGAVTANSANSTITAITFGGSNNNSATSTVGVVYSDKYPFSTTSVIGATSVTVVSKTTAWTTYAMSSIPSGTKSFRIYRIIYYNPTTKAISSSSATGNSPYGSGTTFYCGYVGLTVTPAGPAAPKVTALSIGGTAGTFANDSTLKVNLPYASYTKGQSVSSSLISATTDSSAVTTQILKGATDISSSTFNVGDTITYIVSKNSLSKTYKVITSADVPTPTITTTSSTSQTIKGGATISSIVYVVKNATGATVTGLSGGLTSNLNATSDTLTISGSPSFATYPDTIKYTVTATALSGYTGSAVTATGTIIVRDPSKKSVAFLYTSTTPPTGANKLYYVLNQNYNVDVLAPTTAAAVDAIVAAGGYDLIVLHEALSSSSAAAVELGKFIGQVPILNTKAHMYSKTNWPTGAGGNGVKNDTTINVNTSYLSHPIFSGVTFKSDSVVSMESDTTGIVRYATGVTYGSGVEAIANNKESQGVSIIEKNNQTTSDSKKYMLIALSAASENLNSNGLLVLKNACDYLMSSAVYVPAILTNLTVSAGTMSPAFTPAKKAYKVVLSATATDYPTITPTVITGATLDSISKTAFSAGGVATIYVTSGDGITKATYTITFTDSIPTGIKTATSTFKVYGNGSAVIIEGAAGANVSLVTVSGIKLFTGKTTSTKETLPVSLEKGVYIVVVDGVATKVLVK